MGSIGFDPNRSRIGTDGSDDTTQIGNVIYDGSSRGRGNGSLTVDGGLSDKAHSRRRMNAKLANPLAGFTTAELEEMGANYARKYRIGDEDDVHTFRKGAVLAQNPLRFESMTILDEADKVRLREEVSNRWKQPKLLYLVIVLCSTCAAVQGMDETVVNGAQIFYAKQFGIDGKDDNSTYLVGLTNA